VYQSGRLIIDESEYRDDSGEVIEASRNALIEAHMEKTGVYPEVLRINPSDDLYPVDTRPKA
jgi:hypothetical protein